MHYFILLLILKYITTANCQEFTYTGKQKVKPIRKYQYKSVWNISDFDIIDIDQDEPVMAMPIGNHLASQSTSTPFDFTLNCSEAPEICDNVRRTLDRAGKRIASILTISSTITVNVNYFTFCAGEPEGCPRRRFLGQASPGYLMEIPNVRLNTTIIYPPALLKNSDIGVDARFLNGFDINADFNAATDFYHPRNGTTIKEGQYDFEYVLVHELMHGLGFLSGYVSWYTFYKELVNSYDVYSPQIILVDGKVTRYQSFYIFDMFLTNSGTGESLFDDHVKNNASFTPGKTSKQFFNDFTQSPAFVNGQDLLESATNSKLIFISPFCRSPMPIYAPATYVYLSTGSHLDYSTYVQSPDFLLTHNVASNRGKTLDTIIEENKKLGESFGIFGPGILNIMKAIGWSSPFKSDSNGVVGTFVPINSHADQNIPLSSIEIFLSFAFLSWINIY